MHSDKHRICLSGKPLVAVNFLTSTRASPLREAFRDDGGDRDLLSTYLKATVVEFRHPAVVFYFYAVPVGRMGEVEDKFRSVVGKIVADGPDRLEMDRIRTFGKIRAYSENP